MSDPAPIPAPLPAPSMTAEYITAAVIIVAGQALSLGLINNQTDKVIVSLTTAFAPLVVVAIMALVKLAAHRSASTVHAAHIAAQGARDAAILAPDSPSPASTINVSPECVLRIEASSDQVRRDLVEILAAVRPPESPDAPLRNAVATGVPVASSGNAAVTWNTGAPTAQAASS